MVRVRSGNCVASVARYLHWEEAAVRLPAALTAEGALRQHAEQIATEEQHLQMQEPHHVLVGQSSAGTIQASRQATFA